MLTIPNDVIEAAVAVINNNAYFSLCRDSECVDDLRRRLEELGLIAPAGGTAYDEQYKYRVV